MKNALRQSYAFSYQGYPGDIQRHFGHLVLTQLFVVYY